jgi:hypothetical protein
MRETNASEPLLKHRNRIRWHQNQGLSDAVVAACTFSLGIAEQVLTFQQDVDPAILITPPRKQTSNHAISTWTAGAAFARSWRFTIRSRKMNAEPNSNKMLPCFNRKPSELGADARKQGGQPTNRRRYKNERLSPFFRSSLTVSRRHGNCKNSLAIYVADVDVFD